MMQKLVRFWNSIVTDPPKNSLSELNHRRVIFRFYGLEVPLYYSATPLLKFRRFDVVEYTSTNLLTKIMAKVL